MSMDKIKEYAEGMSPFDMLKLLPRCKDNVMVRGGTLHSLLSLSLSLYPQPSHLHIISPTTHHLFHQQVLKKVPFILKDLLKALKSMLMEIIGVIRGKVISAPNLAYLPGETCGPIKKGMQEEEEEDDEEDLGDDEDGPSEAPQEE